MAGFASHQRIVEFVHGDGISRKRPPLEHRVPGPRRRPGWPAARSHFLYVHVSRRVDHGLDWPAAQRLDGPENFGVITGGKQHLGVARSDGNMRHDIRGAGRQDRRHPLRDFLVSLDLAGNQHDRVREGAALNRLEGVNHLQLAGTLAGLITCQAPRRADCLRTGAIRFKSVERANPRLPPRTTSSLNREIVQGSA